MKSVILALFLVVSSPFACLAEEAPADIILPKLGENIEEARPLRPELQDQVVRAVDHLRLQLKSGRVVELTGIEIPQPRGAEEGDQMVASKEFLDMLFEKETSRDVTLFQTPSKDKGRVNRMGHDLAQIVRRDGHVWVQGALLANGLAQARPTPANPELAEQMYALEDDARVAGKGLWAKDSPYRLLSASEPVETLERFAVIEGVVQKVATVNNVTYLNFGPDWKTDFTLGMTSTVRQALARQGVDVFLLQGQKLRMRGWVRSYNGPYIELEHPVLLQRIEDEQSSASP